MSLTGRFSWLVLTTLAAVLMAYSAALYLGAGRYLDQQVGDRLNSALAVLAAAAEVGDDGVEWEPQERILPLGQDSGPDQLRWLVFDERGRRLDHSRNLGDADLDLSWTPMPETLNGPDRVPDRWGKGWRIAQQRIGPTSLPGSSVRVATRDVEVRPVGSPEERHPSLVIVVGAPLGNANATLATLGGWLVVLSLAIWLGAALICRRMSRGALAPLTRMVASARGLDATDRGWSLERAGTGDELDELGDAFNDLLGRLNLAYERQRRFGGDASHQLRTPLTVLLGQIEVALRQDRPAEEYRRALRSALGGAIHLRQIVEALLFLARSEGESRLPTGEPLDLGFWLDGYLADRASAPSDPRVIHRTPPGPGPCVFVQPALLAQLLENLLDNAAKHGTPGTSILVEVTNSGEEAVLAVEDRGPGIAPEDLPRLFEPFFRSDLARRQGTPGVGLGLAMVERIAHAFGGTAHVRSKPGQGSRFEIRFPTHEPVGDSPELDSQAARSGATG